MAENYRRNHGFEPQNGSTATAPDRFPRAPPSRRRLSGPGRSRCPIRHRALHILSPEKGPKTSKPRLTWTLGPGVTGLREAAGADCGLFTYVRDSYASGGRKEKPPSPTAPGSAAACAPTSCAT